MDRSAGAFFDGQSDVDISALETFHVETNINVKIVTVKVCK